MAVLRVNEMQLMLLKCARTVMVAVALRVTGSFCTENEMQQQNHVAPFHLPHTAYMLETG